MPRSDKESDLKVLENVGVLEIIRTTNGSCNISSTKVGKRYQVVYDALCRLGGRGNVTKNNGTIHVDKKGIEGVYSAARFVDYPI